jgi:hypothetical protein
MNPGDSMNERPTLTRQRPTAFTSHQPLLWTDSPLAVSIRSSLSRQFFVGALLILALFAFELFNFDTTQYALADLLGDVRFAGIGWATILAIAFCGIDFAGLAYLFMPERFHHQARETWYLMGAWLLGATMNAVMTWWAVSLTIMQTQAGNELISYQQLLAIVPVFVAVLVWLTRILFISAFSIAGSHILYERQQTETAVASARPSRSLGLANPIPAPLAELPQISEELPTFLHDYAPARVAYGLGASDGRRPLPTKPPVRQRSPHSTDSFNSLRQQLTSSTQPPRRR